VQTVGVGGVKVTGTQLLGFVTGTPNTFSAIQTFNAANGIVFPGAALGTQVACLGLDASNNVIKSAAACGSGGGGGTVTSVSAGCGTSSGGSPITTTGTIFAAEVPNLRAGTTYTIANADCGTLNNFSNAAAIAVTLPQAGSGGNFAVGWYNDVCSIGAGTATITPTTSTIGGVATLVLTTNKCARIVSDGTNYQVVTYGGGGGGGTPGGATTNVQFNNSGAFGGDSGFTYVTSGQVNMFTVGGGSPTGLEFNQGGNAGLISMFNAGTRVAYIWPGVGGGLVVNVTAGQGIQFSAGTPVFNFLLSGTAVVNFNTSGTTSSNIDYTTNTFAFESGGVAQAVQVYNTWSGGTLPTPTNYERFVIDWTSFAGQVVVGTQKAGTGTARTINFTTASNANPSPDYTFWGQFVSVWEVTFHTGAITIPSGSMFGLAAVGSGAAASSTPDTAIARVAATPGLLDINNGTPGGVAFARLNGVVVASLPACTVTYQGARGTVTNASQTFTAGIGAIVAGGGANIVPVFCDGTNWRIG
jgi:hypothetical protein